MFISGMSGNEIFCLALKGFSPGELTVGNSVQSLGISGGLSQLGRTFAGGEIKAVTDMISDGRHLAIQRMEDEAKRHGAAGVTGVVAELKTLAGYTEFLAQGTAVHATPHIRNAGEEPRFFSTAASGIELYCHLDAGYVPVRYALGNVAYALGIGRGVSGSLRSWAQGEVKDFSQMYNEIRHTALDRLRAEAAAAGANAVVDLEVKILPFGPGTVEFLVTGTASNHPRLAQGRIKGDQVVTSSLNGEELWNLAKLGFVPKQLVMATSIYSLGITAGIGTLFQSMSKGELPEVTQLVYRARENCMALIRKEAEALGATQVIGNKLTIIELPGGMIEVFAIGTAIAPAEGPHMKPATDQLIPQAVIMDPGALEVGPVAPGLGEGGVRARPVQPQTNALGCVIAMMVFGCMLFAGILAAVLGGRH